MILYTTIPSVANDLIVRLKAEATADSLSGIVASLTSIGDVAWYNLPFKLNQILLNITTYQAILVDGSLQDIIDDLGTIYWYDLFSKVNLLIKAVEKIESLT